MENEETREIVPKIILEKMQANAHRLVELDHEWKMTVILEFFYYFSG